MNRNLTWIGLMATLLIFATLVITALLEPVRQARAEITQVQTAIEEGTGLYIDNCIVCHGASGEGLGAYPGLDVARTMDEETLYKTIERGRYDTQMAAYGIDEGGILSTAQIDSLIALIQYGSWGTVYAEAEALGALPPEIVAAPIDEETIALVEALPGGDQLTAGLTLYGENCAACHGASLEGTTLAPALNTADIQETDGFELVRVIEEGVPGTLMAGWDSALDDAEVAALVELLQRWAELDSAGVSVPMAEPDPIDMSPEAIATGQQLFSVACTSCHGTSGYGSPMAPALNNELYLSQTSDTQIHQIIAMGVPGTVMPAWGSRFSEADINAIVAYMRSWEANAPIITTPR